MNKKDILEKIKGGLIVSCQALEDEPLHSSYIMSRMALAAAEGGAAGIRANSAEDISEIKKLVNLPMIGIIKAQYSDSQVYITPTLKEIELLSETQAEIIAMDATDRRRPSGDSLENIISEAKRRYPQKLFMADCSCFEDCQKAEELGFDLIGTTLCGYTESTKGTALPSRELLERITKKLHTPIIAEGGIWSPEQLKMVFTFGIHAAVVGTAITRPREITKRFREILN